MSIESALEDIAGKLHDYGDTLETEEATKNALVMPLSLIHISEPTRPY